MDNIVNLNRLRTWVLFAAGIVIAAALAASLLFTDEPLPIGQYIIFWVLGEIAAGGVILLAYAQYSNAASKFGLFQEVSEAAVETNDSSTLIERLGHTINALHGFKLAAYQLHDEYGAAMPLQMAQNVSIDRGLKEAIVEVLKLSSREAYDLRMAMVHPKKDLSLVQKGALDALKGSAFVVVPLIRGRTLIGMTCFTARSTRRFSEQQRRFAVQLAEEVAGSVYTGLQMQSSEESHQDAESYESVLSALSEQEDLDGVLNTLVNWMSRHANLDGSSISLLDADARAVERIVGEGWLNGRSLRISGEAGGSLIDEAVLERETLVTINDIQEASPAVLVNKELAKRLDVSCVIGTPLKVNGHLLGVVTAVRSRSENPFTNEDERRIQAASALAAIIIENATIRLPKSNHSGPSSEAASFNSELVRNISHELSTSLSSLKAATDMLLNERGIEPGGDYYERLLQSISRNVARQSMLVANIVDIASLEDDTLKLRPERVDIASLIAEATSIVAPLMHQREQTLSVSTPPNPPMIYADKERISQVLINLLTNARKYAPEGAEVSLTVDTSESDIVFNVSDGGQGVPVEERERIFEPFYRIQKDNDSGSSGNGLGLAIAKSLVELHGGRIWVEDSPMGGASFIFALPIEGRNEHSGH